MCLQTNTEQVVSTVSAAFTLKGSLKTPHTQRQPDLLLIEQLALFHKLQR